MSASSASERSAPAFAKDFPVDRAFWQRSADFGVTYAYNPPASVAHPGASPVGQERYKLNFKIPAGLGGTFVFTISGDDFDGGIALVVEGTLWYDGVQINPATGLGTLNSTTINTVPGPHTIEWRHGQWISAGLTAPIITFTYVNTFFTGIP